MTYPPPKPAYRIPLMAEINAIDWNGFTVASSFSGGGGSSLGYRMAGYRVAWASEFIPEAAETYLANAMPYTILDQSDIRTVTPQMVLDALGLEVGELDLWDGSPPCSSFSTAGARSRHWGQTTKYSSTEQRTDDLFWEYARLLEGIQPRVFIAENVSGLAKGVAKGYFKRIFARLEECGYKVAAKRLDASWLGVPQARQRIFFVGVRNDLPAAPAFPKPLPWQYTVRDALPWISAQGHLGIHGTGGYRESERPSPTILASELSATNGHSPGHVIEDGPQPGDVYVYERADQRGGAHPMTRWPADGQVPTLAGHGMANAREYQVGIADDGRGIEWVEAERWPGHYAEDITDGQAPTIIAGQGTAGGTQDGLRVVRKTPATPPPGDLVATERQFDRAMDDITDEPAPTLQSGGYRQSGHGHIRVIHETGGQWSQGDVTDRPSPVIMSGPNSLNSRHFQVTEFHSEFRRPDGSWSCTRDGVTEPCGDCDGCRQVAAENRAAEIDAALPDLRVAGARVVHDTGGNVPVADMTDRPSRSITVGNDNSGHYRAETHVIHDPGGKAEYARGDVTDRPGATVTGQSKEFRVTLGGPGDQAAAGPAATLDPETGEDISLGRYAIGKEWELMRRRKAHNSGKYLNLKVPDEDKPAQSLTAMGGVIGAAGVTHWAECRKLTLLELRRLGGFPDDFVLTGNYRQRWERIGRAVPPPMMAALAAAVRDEILIPLRQAGHI